MDERNVPYGLGGAVYPPQGGDATVVPHEHMFCFVIGEHGAIRGCELCGKAWFVPKVTLDLGYKTQWIEIEEPSEE